MNYAQVRKFDVTNGPGIRSTLFVSGCTHDCKDCFNSKQQDFNYGSPWTKQAEDDFISACLNSNVVGVSILGGEPMQQHIDTMARLLKRIKDEVKKPIWVWTGYTFEELVNTSRGVRLLYLIDVLIDGKFEADKKDLNLLYRGSSNQRVILCKESLEARELKLML